MLDLVYLVHCILQQMIRTQLRWWSPLLTSIQYEEPKTRRPLPAIANNDTLLLLQTKLPRFGLYRRPLFRAKLPTK